MSLFKQLLIAICLFLLVAFSGVFLVSLESSREQYANQLRSHAQDAATALGLSLTLHVDDPAMMELMVSSIFDSGYYASIRVVDLQDGQALVAREGVPTDVRVPEWFAGLIDLQPEAGEAIVSRGWEQAARVEVISHPLFAVARLWQSALGSLAWMLLCGLVSAVLGALVLRRQLRPLDYLVEQSHAIARREFLTLPDLPRTPELRRVVLAMNMMVDKLRALFTEQATRSEQLRSEAYQDSLTGLANRRSFEMQLHSRLDGEERANHGYLLQVRLNDLAGLNQRLGGQRTDGLIKAVAELLLRQVEAHGYGGALVARSRGGEFSLLLPGQMQAEAEHLADALQQSLCSLHATGASDVSPVAFIGLVPFTTATEASALLRQADEALVQAESRSATGWVCLEQARAAAAQDEALGWRRLLDEALTERRLLLHVQPVVDARKPGQVLHYKVLSRLTGTDGEPIPAGRFLPWIERFGWSERLDRAMLECVLQQMKEHPRERLALNLSASSLADPQILNLLRQHRDIGPRLTIELQEGDLPTQQELELLTRQLHVLGFGLSLQHFGGRFSLIGNLARLGLAWLKIDASYIRDIDRESDKRLFIETMQRAADSIDLPLIAERVESEGELQVLREIGIQGVQGRLFGEPRPWGDVPG